MKNFVAFFLLFSCLAMHVPDDNSLHINLKFITTEKSKDSYTYTESITVNNGVLSYSTNNSRKKTRPAPKILTAKLTKAELEALLKTIEENKLFVIVPAEKRAGFKSPYNATTIVCKTKKGNSTGDIYLYDLSKSISAKPQYKGIQQLKIELLKLLKE